MKLLCAMVVTWLVGCGSASSPEVPEPPVCPAVEGGVILIVHPPAGVDSAAFFEKLAVRLAQADPKTVPYAGHSAHNGTFSYSLDIYGPATLRLSHPDKPEKRVDVKGTAGGCDGGAQNVHVRY